MTNNIREERQKKGITLETMSEELSSQGLKISADGLAKYERGIREPKIGTWKKLADYFGVSVVELMGIDKIREINNHGVRMIESGHNKLLNTQLNRLKNNELKPMQPLAVAYAIQLAMDLFENYEYNSDISEEVFSTLNALVSMINNSIDDDADYQNTIDTFTKLVNNLKAQNKKVSDDKPKTE